ncbi:hypothetical protein ASG31_13445 [Chryseobacterium sp. Leaf404]|uniref:hypothetical protein n=1 Tax=unclassified Chryseobacterium TaxID=2593645 RepID=UPI0006F5CB15|nr:MULTISPECIES: hypothetical protein [unclassified Chryseobacterium]KQT16510.1 hypothetical protein ASG31_13445 [Chryseobacterium sp. Leaf404]
MENLESVKLKLLSIGYSVYLIKIDNVEYLRGGIVSNDILKNIGAEIWIKQDKNIFIFLDIENQKGNEKPFDNSEKLINYIKEKYPL